MYPLPLCFLCSLEVPLIDSRLLCPSPDEQADEDVFEAFDATRNLISAHKLTVLRDLLYYAEVPSTRSRSRFLPMASALFYHAERVRFSFLYWRDARLVDAPPLEVSQHGFHANGVPIKGSDEDIEAWGLHQTTCNCKPKAGGVMCGDRCKCRAGPLGRCLPSCGCATPELSLFFLLLDARCRQA